ncbi:hypothetical protein KM043_010586 [Ampulex compressa]|nr:hypothetical protein KM043_010586 [Ampulex compressa]
MFVGYARCFGDIGVKGKRKIKNSSCATARCAICVLSFPSCTRRADFLVDISSGTEGGDIVPGFSAVEYIVNSD